MVLDNVRKPGIWRYLMEKNLLNENMMFYTYSIYFK